MKQLFVLLTVIAFSAQGQKLKKADKAILTSLNTNIGYLADDKLEGRRTGTAGEKLAYEYISKAFENAGLIAKGDNGTYIQNFEVNDGREVSAASYFTVNNNRLECNKDYFPFAFSPNAKVETSASIALPEKDNIWFWDLKEVLEENAGNPHFDLDGAIQEKVKKVTAKGATGLLIYNTSNIKDELKFDARAKPEPTKIPVYYIMAEARKAFINDETATYDFKINTVVEEKKRTGHNVIGYIDNGAATTVIIGAHYDHLGYGEDHNSLYTGTTPMIHNGADDNASGTAAIIELGKLLKASKLTSNNYLFIAFSGEELGLFGSKYYTEHPETDLAKTNYMVNLDMVGRLNDSTHGLTIGGYGTSPAWAGLIPQKDKFFTIKFDSSGSGPSDHTSFYRKDIPVLFFFTGVHSDYHKPSDDADKINYEGELQVIKYIYTIIEAANKKEKLAFTKTRETQSMGKSSFKVTLGIMPDYTYSGDGVRVDGVSEGKTAQKAGIKPGDVITQLGDNKFTDVETYMHALSKFNKGDATKVKVRRGKEELYFDIVF